VFYSELQEDGSWGEANNLGYPLNTTDDDFTFEPMGVQDEVSVYLFSAGDPEQHPLFKFEIFDRDALAQAVPFDDGEEVVEIEEEIVEEVVVEVVPEPVKPTEKYLIKPVFFGFDSSTLSAVSKSALDETARLMKKFPTLQLEVVGHTDAMGSFEYNQALSQRRAKAVADYLVSSGLSTDRLIKTGKSESEHVALNRTKDNRDAPEGRQLNRRVEFNVSVAEDVFIEMEKILVPDYLKIQE
jgi:outer membrane protein OmpA-like peptidoglycan-associated protein